MVAKKWYILVLLIILVGLVSCAATEEATIEPEVPERPGGTPSVIAVPRSTSAPLGGVDVAMEHIQHMEGAVLATVNGEEITWEEYVPSLQQGLVSISRQYQLDWNDPAMQERLGYYQNTILEQMVDRVLLRQMATAEGIEIIEADVNAQIDQEKSKMLENAPASAWNDFLSANGLTDESYRQYVYERLLMEDLVSRQEVESQAEQVHILYITVTDGELAQAVVEELKAGRDFAEMAELYSEDTESKSKGGDLGWFTRESLPNEIEAVAFTLEPGQFSDPIATEARYIIIKVAERAMRDLEVSVVMQLQQQALLARITNERDAAQIEYLVVFDTGQGE